MGSKRATSEEVKGMLVEGHFGENNSDPLPLSDPISITQMILKLAEIKEYDKNPRKEKNPLYEEIKASIRNNRRLNNNVNVTRRPGDKLYMIDSGGNTRLKILNDLYKETGDEKFNQVHCLFVPWVSESSILTAHLIENEMRGDVLLIDKAYAIKSLQEELELELDQELSRNEFSKLATSRGYKISRRHITRFYYAIELDTMIPNLLRSGLGSSKIDQIKKLHQAYLSFCKDKTDQFDLLFIEVMSENDHEDFNIKELRTDIDEKLEAITGIQNNHIYLEIQSIMVDSKTDQPELPTEQFIDNEDTFINNTEEHLQITQPSSRIDQQNPQDHAAAQKNTNPALGQTTAIDSQQSTSTESNASTKEQHQTNKTERATNHQTFSLADLRSKNFKLASLIAKEGFIDEVVYPVDVGFGFLIKKPNEPFIFNNKDSAKTILRYFTWWFLIGLSEQYADPQHLKAWEGSELMSLLTSDKSKEYLGVSPHLKDVMCLFVHRKTDGLSEQCLTYFFSILENIRVIKDSYEDLMLWNLVLGEN